MTALRPGGQQCLQHHPDPDQDQSELEERGIAVRPRRVAAPGRDDEPGHREDQDEQHRVPGPAGRDREPDRPQPPGPRVQRPGERGVVDGTHGMPLRPPGYDAGGSARTHRHPAVRRPRRPARSSSTPSRSPRSPRHRRPRIRRGVCWTAPPTGAAISSCTGASVAGTVMFFTASPQPGPGTRRWRRSRPFSIRTWAAFASTTAPFAVGSVTTQTPVGAVGVAGGRVLRGAGVDHQRDPLLPALGRSLGADGGEVPGRPRRPRIRAADREPPALDRPVRRHHLVRAVRWRTPTCRRSTGSSPRTGSRPRRARP